MVIKQPSPATLSEHGVIAVLGTSQAFQPLIHDLIAAGVQQDAITFMAKGAESESSERLQQEGRSEVGGMLAGGLTGLFAGLSVLAVPGFGILFAGGPMLAGAVALAGSLGGVGLGAVLGAILEEDVVKGRKALYEEHLAAGHTIVIVVGSTEDVALAHGVLKEVPTQALDVY